MCKYKYFTIDIACLGAVILIKVNSCQSIPFGHSVEYNIELLSLILLKIKGPYGNVLSWYGGHSTTFDVVCVSPTHAYLLILKV